MSDYPKIAQLKTVGVFRGAGADEVARAVEALRLDAVQLHGEEDEAALAALRARLPKKTELWAVCGVSASRVPPGRTGADRTLFDTVRDGQSGGTGTAFDWSLLDGREDLRNAVIAGGIGPANARAAASLGAHAIDVNSGVEEAPGRKDRGKVEALFAALRPKARGDHEA